MIQSKKIIGLTGSIATGKSEVSKNLIKKGFKVIDSDKIARDIINRKDVVKKIKKEFGENLYKSSKLNREKLAKIIFSNREKKEALDNITHPIIFDKIFEEIKNINSNIIFIDMPLLIENYIKDNLYGLKFDEIWLVYTKKDIQIKRLIIRDNIDYDYALEKINSQMDIEDKLKYADVVIDNSKTLIDLEEEIEKNLERIKND